MVLADRDVVTDDSDDGGDRSLDLAQGDFMRPLESMRETHDVVPLDKVPYKLRSHCVCPRAATTSNNAYRRAITISVPGGASRRIRCSTLVTPGLLHGKASWRDDLSLPGQIVDPELRDTAFEPLGRDAGSLRAWPTTPASVRQLTRARRATRTSSSP